MAEVTGATVAAYLGQSGVASVEALADQHAKVVKALARSYTRGNGFDSEGVPTEDIEAVITTATARMVANPEQAETRFGSTWINSPGFQGWNLAEVAVLNRWRGRSA